MNEERFSFSILTYRNFDGIYETLDSLFMQDYRDIELIISDDGSEEYEKEIVSIKEYISKNKSSNVSNVVFTHLECNKGTVENLNNAIKISSGRYFKTLGCGDSFAEVDALSRYAEVLRKEDTKLVFSKLIGITKNGEKVKYLASCEDNYDLLREMTPKELENRLYIRNCLPAPAWAARKDLFEEFGLFPNTARLIEDYPYWIFLCQNGQLFTFIDDILVKYKLDGVSSTGKYSKTFMDDMFKIYEKHIFPYDKRYGLFQPIYNYLKRQGLRAYLALAEWDDYSVREKIFQKIKYLPFFIYIDIGERLITKRNRNV
ncbi:MAG: glycosyltransferase [Pseudobutyrivibrio sp.]|nr:glycosyltransferase [Pseudobutyrivibrio sp.]